MESREMQLGELIDPSLPVNAVTGGVKTNAKAPLEAEGGGRLVCRTRLEFRDAHQRGRCGARFDGGDAFVQLLHLLAVRLPACRAGELRADFAQLRKDGLGVGAVALEIFHARFDAVASSPTRGFHHGHAKGQAFADVQTREEVEAGEADAVGEHLVARREGATALAMSGSSATRSASVSRS